MCVEERAKRNKETRKLAQTGFCVFLLSDRVGKLEIIMANSKPPPLV
jgi:hypothetical protein